MKASERFAITLQGPDSIAAAQAVRMERKQKREWPYPWVFPPPDAQRVTAGLDASGTLVVPTAASGINEGLAYTVDEGYQFALEKLVVIYIGGAAAPGDFLWSLTLNSPLLGPAVFAPTYQGNSVQGFNLVDVPLGSLQIPWPLAEAELFQPNDTIRTVFTNVNLNDGAGNFFKSIFIGWKWPA